ncbi:hypothetical protein CAEBREN_14591 [Caenorhabditis brenneri]|uniref:non-specific serine/threonine protein kinase n=1 Tax=Caenorhabditis brenneri TaxID=135651 RepID=G0ME93_CAEBE|nr:hypothetical protein CAEBREN_14591 [Caenorhabditis brenneri]
MDLIKKKFDKKKKKMEKKKKEKQIQKKCSGQTKQTKKKKKKKKEKKRKRNSRSRESSSEEESEDSDDSQRQLKTVQSKLAVDAANINSKYRMAGGLIKKPEDPPNFAKKLLETEWREMTVASNVTNETLNTLDMYLRDRAELRSTDHVVISETVDDEDQKSTTRLKILTKFDEGRFAAIYMVQNESAVDNDVVSVGNARFMMKTALRHLSSHQIVYRLSREISALKMLWSKGNDQPLRIPPIHHQGKVLGFPFYVTSIYDVNLEKCREQMGGGSFCVQSAFHIAQEIFTAIKFIHRRQLVHRDIKPTNIVLSYQNRDQWYLIDYGDCITVGKNSALSPPDGITLPFLSLEAHDLLYTTAYSTFQQDLESWFYVLVDLIKPLPWRDNNRIDKVALAKRDFLNRLPICLSDYPPQVLEIGKLLRSDTQPSYPEISRKLSEGMNASKKSMSGEKWNPEWYDRSATKKLKARKPMNKQKRSREVSDAEGTVTTTVDSVESGTNEKKDGSVYISEIRPTPPALNQSNRKKGSSPAPPPSNNPTNKVAQMIDDDEPPQRNQSPVQKQQERSVYFNDFPIITPDVGGKKKYRYKLKK